MPGTAFPDPIEDPDATERDAIADADRAHNGDLADAIVAAVESGLRREGVAGGEEGRVAREEALERLRQQFLGEKVKLTGELPPEMDYTEPAIGGWNSGAGNTLYTENEFKEEWPEPLKREDLVNPGARVQRWADVAMWKAPEHDDPQHPKVWITDMTHDPLGVMAMVNGMYTGKVYTHPSQVSDEERREAWEAATVSKLSKAPMEWMHVGILFENVTRAFTHQLVRTRLAGYAQESLRFAVKDDIDQAVKLPPSLAGTHPWPEFERLMIERGVDPAINARKEQYWRRKWDDCLAAIAQTYEQLVDDGMPAEDARGLLPTNILTRVHEHIDIQSLIGMAGMRLCTQAQFEWREVFAKLAGAIRDRARYDHPDHAWQYDLIADAFRPVCYAAGRCVMKADSDRACTIRERVDAFAAAGVPSSKWNRSWADDRPNPVSPDYIGDGVGYGDDHTPTKINAIHPREWLADPTAARVAPGQE